MSTPKPPPYVNVTVQAAVPPRFGPVRILLQDSRGDIVTPADVCVAMIDGRAEFTKVDIDGWASGRPNQTLAPAELSGIDWVRAAADAVFVQAARHLADDATTPVDERRRLLHEVRDATNDSRRYNRLTTDQLLRVAELYHRGRASLVAKEFCVSRRQADRYIKRARDEGAL